MIEFDPNNSIMILGNRIRKLRISKNWAQDKLAHEAGLDRSYIGCVERGERNLSFTSLCKIALALNTDVGTLTNGLPSVCKTEKSVKNKEMHFDEL